MQDHTLMAKAVTKSSQPKRVVAESTQSRPQTSVRPVGMPRDLLHLQRWQGNHYLQRTLLARKGEGESEVVRQETNQGDNGTETNAAAKAYHNRGLKPLSEALQAFMATVRQRGKGLAGAAQLAEQASPGKTGVEIKLRDTLQEALALEKELREKHPDYAKQGGFQGYGENRTKDQYVCTTFAEEVLKRAGYKVTGAVGGQINIAVNWETELGKKEPTAKEKTEALAKLVAQGDPRTKGVVAALVGSKQGVEVTIDQLRPGDFVQYWSSYTSGHVVQVREVISPGIIMAHGSHQSTRGITTVQVNLKAKKKVYCVRPIGGGAPVAAGSPPTTSADQPVGAGTEPSAWLERAVKDNAMWGSKLDWVSRVDEIVTHLQKLGYAQPLQTPGPDRFASAIRQYQIQNPPLVQDGVLGPGTWRRLQAEMNRNASLAASAKTTSVPKTTLGKGTQAVPLTGLKGLERSMAKIANDYGTFLEQQSTGLGIDVADAAGFLQVESGGRGSSSETGKMIIRFENHLFYQFWGNAHREQFDQHFRFAAKKKWLGHEFRTDPKGEFGKIHTNQMSEWQVLEFARKLDEEAALKSISMGLAQILGSNHKILGYSSAKEMFDAMSGSLQTQAGGLFEFIANDRGGAIVKALKAKDYTLAARYYNGAGQQELYGSKLKAASEAYARVVNRKAAHSP